GLNALVVAKTTKLHEISSTLKKLGIGGNPKLDCKGRRVTFSKSLELGNQGN
ncbi:hypothetical protein GWI33_016446, partial [Rhynchophorus ferrugineus]